jgi:hypothetical protein
MLSVLEDQSRSQYLLDLAVHLNMYVVVDRGWFSAATEQSIAACGFRDAIA